MAQYSIKDVEHDGIIAPPAPIRLTEDGNVSPATVLAINQTLAAIVKHINGGLSVGTGQARSRVGNFQNQWLVFTSPSAADTEFELPHGLGRTPIGFTTWFVNKAGVLYIDNYGSWNRDRILLKCSTGTTACVIELA